MIALAGRLLSQPLSSPFTKEVIVVPSPAMARWLNLKLAQQIGVATNFHYPLLASWLWEVTAACLKNVPENDPLDRNHMSWTIFSMLPAMKRHPDFLSLKNYLQDDPGEIKQWQLALRIADVFDRYQFYRPNLIRLWSQKGAGDWQHHLWYELIKRCQNNHRIAVIDRLISSLSQQSTDLKLPERVTLFAFSSIPPLFIDTLHALATRTSINLYLHSPTDQYWADLTSKKQISRIRLKSPDKAAYYESGNPLLASWGRQGQALQDLILNHNEPLVSEWENYSPPQTDSLLGHVQNAIFTLCKPAKVVHKDESIQIHCCHSPLRECQILHDQLLKILDKHSSIRPEDILVMIPEISLYAPYIEAVFQYVNVEIQPFIPWNLSDTTVADEHPLIQIFFQLLDLPGSRFTVSEIFSYLDVPELTARFGLNASACETLRTFLSTANIHWGLDGTHKKEMGLPEQVENTWKQLETRIFSGYGLGDVDYWCGIAPLPGIEGQFATTLGQFWILFKQLQMYRKRLDNSYSIEDWQLLLNQLMDDFFQLQEDDDSKLQQIRDALNTIKQQANGQILPPELIRYCLKESLEKNSVVGRYFSGGVSFCGMRPMRSLPFQIICLLGMNDQSFPRRESPIEFDHMAQNWLPGDPRKGDEDRYLLLETLLCTRKILYISYCGRDMKDNSTRQPSPLIDELLDFIDESFPLDNEQSTLSKNITRIHPMQAFSPQCYLGDMKSYNHYWHQIAELTQNQPSSKNKQVWPTYKLKPLGEQMSQIDPQRLRRFLQHPIKYFFNQRLKIWLQEEDKLHDDEPFALDSLQQWQLKTALTQDFLHHENHPYEYYQAQACLPHGILSEIDYAKAQNELAPFLDDLQGYVGKTPQSKNINLQLANGVQLSGQINLYYPGQGVLHCSPSKIKSNHLMSLWVDHLCLCASGFYAATESSYLQCKDTSLQLKTLSVEKSTALLNNYLNAYYEGQLRPLPVFPGASYAWATEKNTEKAAKKAINAWNGVEIRNIPGDRHDTYIRLVHYGFTGDPFSHEEFPELSSTWYGELLNQADFR